MPIDPQILQHNRGQLQRLERLVASNPDYTADLGGGWTVAVAFAHLAFWDYRQAELIRNWSAPESVPSAHTDDQLNPVLERFWQQMPHEQCGAMAVEAARQITELVEQLDSRTADAIAAAGDGYMLARGRHREEHIDQIERGLSLSVESG